MGKNLLDDEPALNISHAPQRVLLWCLRILWHTRSYRQMLGTRSPRFFRSDLMLMLNLEDGRLDPEDESALERMLGAWLRRLERNQPPWPQPLGRNLDALQARLGLADTERDVLGLLCMAQDSDELLDAIRLALEGSRFTVQKILALALDREPDAVATALAPDGPLFDVGLICNGEGRRGRGSVELTHRGTGIDIMLLDGLAHSLMTNQGAPEQIFVDQFRLVAPDTGSTLDFSHCADDLDQLAALLRYALREREPGVNVLIHGVPGTGKTELVRALARRLNVELIEIASARASGDPVSADTRVRACRLCQCLLRNRDNTLILFDEVEDTFERRVFDRYGTSPPGKAWLNRLLEDNRVPTVWVANGLDTIDPAHLRRYDYVLELEPLSPAVSKRMLRTAFAGIPVSRQWLEGLARQPDLTPAQISQIGRLARRLRDSLGGESLEAVLSEQLERQHVLQGNRRREEGGPLPSPVDFRADCLNVDCDLDGLVQGLERTASGRLLLYGPPGTGKTAFARHLAERLQRPLHHQAASDLLNCFLGATEKNIRAMFDKARRDGAVLLLDEADSFLRGREGARQRWEVSQVNELLVRMEQFDGVFLCATNLREIMDQASFRRFDLKIGFGYPDTAQRMDLFRGLLRALDVPLPRGRHVAGYRERLARLDTLAPGDFAAVARRYQRFGATRPTPTEVLTALAGEATWKPDATQRGIGFV